MSNQKDILREELTQMRKEAFQLVKFNIALISLTLAIISTGNLSPIEIVSEKEVLVGLSGGMFVGSTISAFSAAYGGLSHNKRNEGDLELDLKQMHRVTEYELGLAYSLLLMTFLPIGGLILFVKSASILILSFTITLLAILFLIQLISKFERD